MEKPKIIAFYLPQFHPFPENDKWWGKGFTEWTNVGKAQKLYHNHYQPKIPADLGYYDLRINEVREEQAQLAKEAGIEGFCYWHYWFGGKGRQLMNRIIDEVHANGTPDLPFCLGWANDSWKAKQWNKDEKGDVLLMEQRYEGEEDYRAHYEYVRELFKDTRYIRIEGNPFFFIYRPFNFKDIRTFIELWNKWVKEDGIAQKVYFAATMEYENEYSDLMDMGLDAVAPTHIQRVWQHYESNIPLIRKVKKAFNYLTNGVLKASYKQMNKNIWIDRIDSNEHVLPQLVPNWDHTPRSGRKGLVLHGSTPELFYQQAKRTLSEVKKKQNKIIMLKSWNEWGEGNYMEPDLKFGKGYIKALRKAIDEIFPAKQS